MGKTTTHLICLPAAAVFCALGFGIASAPAWQSDNGDGTFQGEQLAIFCYNPHPGDGFVDVGPFHFTDRHE